MLLLFSNTPPLLKRSASSLIILFFSKPPLLSPGPTEPSSDTEARPDPDTANNLNDVEVIDTTNASPYNVSNNIMINDVDSGHTNGHDPRPPDMQEIQTGAKSSYPHRISVSSILLLTLLFLLYS